jgi:murein L,D-transpeptidase YcbB/YkuD
MIKWLRERSLPTRVVVYAVAAFLAFALAAGVGATAALMLQGNLSLPTRGEPQPAGEQGERQGVDRSQKKGAGAEQKEDASQQAQAEYTNKVGDIQSKSVETFLDSHDKFMSYDAITAEDIEEMHTDQAALKGFADQVNDLDPPQKYKEQHEVFRSAINELYEATKLAYTLAADPTAATKSGFDEHDRLVDQAAAHLKQSNKMLGRDYKTLEGARMEDVSPL